MNEEEKEEEKQKVRISRLAVKSMMLVAIALIIFTFRFFRIGDVPTFFMILYPTTMLAGLIIAFTLSFRKSNCRFKDKLFAGLSIAIYIFSLVWALMTPPGRTLTRRPKCRLNLSSLSKVLRMYSDDYKDKYPTADKWCDLLRDYPHVGSFLVCPAHRITGERCSYAINPYCEPNSPPDTVLLFETKGGWNQFGGIELASTGNHPYKRDRFWGYKIRGCNILFNDGSVRFVREEEFSRLKWKPVEFREE